jgi:hypothetical protein
MSVAQDFLKQVGDSGFPLGVDPSLENTWKVYHKSETPEKAPTRILEVLGFLHLVHQAGMKRLLADKTDPATTYKAIRQEEFDTEYKDLARNMVKYRLFDVLKNYKSRVAMSMPTRGDSRTFRFDMCLEPKKNEPLDSALTKLRGMLYRGDLPRQMQEQWKKLPTTSNAKHKSALPRYTQVMGSETTIGFAPLYATPKCAILAKRVAGDMLIIRLTATVDAKPVPWLSARKHDEVLKTFFTKSFK